MDQFSFLISFISELLYKAFHVSVSGSGHQIMYGESTAFFEHSERLPQKLLFVCSGYVVIYVIARHSIKGLIRVVKMHRITFAE